MNEYRSTQIIKHALQYYITRENASAKDIAREKRLLEWYSNHAEELKEKYRIKGDK